MTHQLVKRCNQDQAKSSRDQPSHEDCWPAYLECHSQEDCKDRRLIAPDFLVQSETFVTEERLYHLEPFISSKFKSSPERQETKQGYRDCKDKREARDFLDSASPRLFPTEGLPASQGRLECLRHAERLSRFCHRTNQNQPVGVESKPATLRCGFHNRFKFGFKLSLG